MKALLCSGSEEPWDRHHAEEDRRGAEPGRADPVPEEVHRTLQPRCVSSAQKRFFKSEWRRWMSPKILNLCRLFLLVSATHKETKQFFTLYNTLDDKKVYLEKEVSTRSWWQHGKPRDATFRCTQIYLLHVNDRNVLWRLQVNLLNSIHDNFQQ